MLKYTCQKGNQKGGFALKKYVDLYGVLATIALMVTSYAANSACSWITYQEKLPDTAKALRKF